MSAGHPGCHAIRCRRVEPICTNLPGEDMLFFFCLCWLDLILRPGRKYIEIHSECPLSTVKSFRWCPLLMLLALMYQCARQHRNPSRDRCSDRLANDRICQQKSWTGGVHNQRHPSLQIAGQGVNKLQQLMVAASYCSGYGN